MLTIDETTELTNALRRQMLYTTPTPVFRPGTQIVERFNVTIHAADYVRIRALIEKAGGWTIDDEDSKAALLQFEQKARLVGGGYGFADWSAGELVTLIAESSGVPELAEFRKAAEQELRSRSA